MSGTIVRRSLAAGVAGILGLSVAGCNGGGASSGPEKPGASPRATIEVVRVVERPIEVNLQMPGELTPFEAVAIFPKVTGFVRSIRVDRGTHVRAGDLMAVLEAPELASQRAESQSRLQGAEAQLAAARSHSEADASTYEKLKAASATPGVVAGNDLLAAQKALEADLDQVAAAEQTVEAARQALNSVTEMEGYLRVTAPFEGIVTERNVHPGALVGPNSGPAAATPMVSLVQTRRLRLVVPVPEAYVAGLVEGTSVQFSVPAYPGRTFSGTLARISHAVDVKTRTMAIELDVANPDGDLAPGTFCQVSWPVRRAGPSLLVPSGSVASTTDRVFVVRVRDGRTEWVDVKTGLTSGSLVEVFGALRPGDQVAARGTDELRPGTEVDVRELDPAAS